jgi:hypothetical protein
MKQILSVPFSVLWRTGSLALAALCLTTVLAAGCTGTTTNSPGAATTLTPLTAPSSGTAAAVSGLSYDPIVGVWRSPGAIYKFEITFDVNGKTQENYASVPNVFYNGTWVSLGDTQYLVTRDTGEKYVWIHDMSANTVYKKAAPAIVYTLYQGVGRASAAPGGSTTVSGAALLSGNGSSIVPFTATESGLWIFTLNYTDEKNFIVWITDDQGKRVALLANEIGTYSGMKPQKLDAGKYYLDVTANGPWTIRAAVS